MACLFASIAHAEAVQEHQLADRPLREAPRLGKHRLTITLLSLQAATLGGVAAAFYATGLAYDWRSNLPLLMVPGGLLLVWACFLAEPGHNPADWVYAESFLAAALMLSFMLIGPPGQYAMIALQRPLIDPVLASADNLMGIDVGRIAAWTRQSPPWFQLLLLRAYLSFGVQLFLPLLLIGFGYRRRTHLWEYVWHFYFCSIGVLLMLALWPAEGPFLYYGGRLQPVFEFGRYAEHFRGIYTGTLRVVPMDMEGLVSLPSFHAAAAIMVTWAFRFSRFWLSILVPLNALLLSATIMSGAHYAADLIATGALFAASVTLWRWRVSRWMDQVAPLGWPKLTP
jgi:hypothetical protein